MQFIVPHSPTHPHPTYRARPLRGVILAFGVLAASAVPHSAAALASSWARNPQGAVRLIAADRVAARQGELLLGVQFEVAPSWHVYWKNSGDAGFAPMVTLAPTPGLSDTVFHWPAPSRFDLPGGLVAYGYERAVVYPLTAKLARGRPGAATLALRADVDYLTCQIDCVPYRYTLSLDLPLAAERVPDPETAPLIATWLARVPEPLRQQPGVRAAARLERDPPDHLVLELSLDGVTTGAQAPDLFFESRDDLALGKPVSARRRDGVTFRVPMTPKVLGHPIPESARFAWTMTGLIRDGRPVSLEGDSQVGAAAGSPAAPAVAGPRLPPPVAASLAALGVLGALVLWGFLGRGTAGNPAMLAGFALLAAALVPLYQLSLSVRSEALAGIEILLLAMALLAWSAAKLRHKVAIRWILVAGVAACIASSVWLAESSRLEPAAPAAPSSAPAAPTVP
jgi:suppressor for copper-sensitivity B